MNTTATMRALDDKRGAVRVEDVYDTDIEDLWNACTTPERLARWIATVNGDLRVGGTINATFTSSWTGPGRIEVCDQPRHLLLTMEPDTDDEAELEAWLSEEGDRTRLAVEERGLPLDRLYFHGAGWQAHLEDLARALDGKPSAWKARWTELTPHLRNDADHLTSPSRGGHGSRGSCDTAPFLCGPTGRYAARLPLTPAAALPHGRPRTPRTRRVRSPARRSRPRSRVRGRRPRRRSPSRPEE
jgi:uncharacterized protein YndB with AHSA1/START domain